MPPIDLASVLQVILALGLINVWLVRSGKATAFRGGASTNLHQEFAAYGLSDAVFYLVGALKLASAASLLAALMLGALAMHLKVKDPLLKSVPALAMLAMTTTLAVMKLG